MSDLISRAEAKEALRERFKRIPTYAIWAMHIIDELPTHPIPSNTLGALDCVERRLVSYKLTDLVNEFEEILSHIREREENDSVCGLCEYDGAYMGQSGDWCNECPGFDKADCFKLKDKYKKEWLELMNTLPSAQPDVPDTNVGELISRQKAKDAIDMALDHIDHVPPWVYDKLLNALNEVPAVQPETNCSEIPNNSDLISRQAAIDAVNNHFGFSVEEEYGSAVQEVLNALPSVQPDKDLIHLQKEQAYMQGYEDGKTSRKGKWINHIEKGFCDCDYCGEILETERAYRASFCPNCGADMRGDSDDR